MAYEFKLPDVGEGTEEAEVLKWMVDVGDGVREDDPVAEIETERAIIEIPSPVDGKVRRFHAERGETVRVGGPLVTFDTSGGSEEARNDGGVEILDSDGNAAVDVDAEGETEEVEAQGDGGEKASQATRELAREIGVDLDEVEGSGEDGSVLAQDILHAAKEGQDEREEERKEDDEESGEEDDGTGAAIPGKGEKTPTMEDDKESPEFGQGETPAVEHETAEETSMFGDETPVAERTDERRERGERDEKEDGGADADDGTTETEETATEHGAQGAETEGRSGDERAEGPFEAASRSSAVGEGAYIESETPEAAESDEKKGEADEEEDRETRALREPDASDMETEDDEAPTRLPPMTHRDVTDAERLVDVLETLRDAVGVRMTYTPILVKAVAEAVADDGAFGGPEDEPVDTEGVNVGVATWTDDGVAVPAVENADEKGVAEIAADVIGLVEDAGSGVLDETPEVAVTLVNIGAVGGDGVSPVVDKPGAGTVTVGEVRERPRVVDGEVVARYTAPLSVTFDGRAADTAEVTRFTNRVKRYLTEPAAMLL